MNFLGGTATTSFVLFLPGVTLDDCPDEDVVLQNIIEAQSSSESDSDGPTSFIPDNDDFSSSTSSHHFQSTNDSLSWPSNSPWSTPVWPTANWSEPTADVEYDSMPEYFVDIQSWPKTINRLCWCCSNRIRGIPWFIPLGYNKIIQADGHEVSAMKTHGSFDSPFCAKRYILRVNDDKITNSWESIQLLNQVYSSFSGQSIIDIPEAEDPFIQLQYCGPQGITAGEYRNRNDMKLALK